ncbi:MAG: SDR family NAD(P)-dependent oxidoreductase [Bdellovibrionales bacterium]
MKCLMITGTSRGLGLKLAKKYVDRYQVIGASRSPAAFSDPRYLHFEADLSDERAVLSMFDAIAASGKKVDGLINNAGQALMNHALLTTGEGVDRIFGSNFKASFLCSREAARHMHDSPSGRIVNISSIASELELEGELVYASSKAAIEKMTNILARELAAQGTTVNCISLPSIGEGLIAHVPPKKLEELRQRQTIKRDATVDDVINALDFILSPNSGMISGQILKLGGF